MGANLYLITRRSVSVSSAAGWQGLVVKAEVLVEVVVGGDELQVVAQVVRHGSCRRNILMGFCVCVFVFFSFSFWDGLSFVASGEALPPVS